MCGHFNSTAFNSINLTQLTDFNSTTMLKNYRFSLLGTAALLAISWTMLSGCHSSTTPPVVAPSQFLVTPLTANKATYGAANLDTNMQDTWGLAFNTTYGYPWIANRASGTTSILDPTGKAINHYLVKGPGGVVGSPTGIVPNTTTSFQLPVNAVWIFSQLNGTIAATTSGTAQADSTFIVADESHNSSYSGLALVTNSAGISYLYAPNIRNGSLDQFSGNYVRFQSGEQATEQGYTPFNAVLIDTQLFVTSAKMATVGGNPFVGIGPGFGGYVDIYSINGNFERTLITNDSLDSPWGVAIAPSNFGSYSGDLLVGNFGDGKIHAYNRSSGALLGTLNDATGAPITIPGLWALVVYNGTLYYTAGPNAGADGVFGTITVK
jgi:uncharacterized protein (TIGR03118 family)